MDDSLLCELVGNHPSLYDAKNKLYKDQSAKDNVWKEIADILEQSVDDCKKRWKNIRDTYNRRKRNGKVPTLGSTTSTKASKWYLQDALSFLNVVEFERRNTPNVPDSNLLDSDSDEDDRKTSEFNENGQIGFTHFLNIVECEQRSTSNVPDSNMLGSGSEEDDRNTSEFSENEQKRFTQNQEENPFQKTVSLKRDSPNVDILNEQKSDINQRITQKRPAFISGLNSSKRQKNTDEDLDIIQHDTDARSERLNAIETRNVEEHPIDPFFRSMALSVKQLSHSSQIRAKMEICRIVGELELKELQQ